MCGLIEPACQIQEVHAEEAGQECQGEEEARDDGQRLHGVVQPIRNSRQIDVHRAGEEVTQRVDGFVLADQVVVNVAPVKGQLLAVDVNRVGDEALEKVALRADELTELDNLVLELVYLAQQLRRRVFQDFVFESVDALVKALEQREQRIDEIV